MSEWMEGYKHVDRWLRLAGRLEGVIEAHRIMKNGEGDDYDRILWKMAEQVSWEAENERP